MTTPAQPLRVLFCIGINQNFFDLPKNEIGSVWTAFSGMMSEMARMQGVQVIGNMDDDSHMVPPVTPLFFHPNAISPSPQNALWCRSLRAWRNLIHDQYQRLGIGL